MAAMILTDKLKPLKCVASLLILTRRVASYCIVLSNFQKSLLFDWFVYLTYLQNFNKGDPNWIQT